MQPILRLENLEKRYTRSRAAGVHKSVVALGGVSLAIQQGTTLALVGESGSGKSTLALCAACLERPTAGSIWFEGREVAALVESEQRKIRPQIQLVFQDPASSLNPRFTALEIVSEPLLVQQRLDKQKRTAKALELLDRIGIPREKSCSRPDEFSGGQRQRLAIARALALEPKVLILDEALSALDCSVQAQVANLLVDLQSDFGLTYLFITHDLAMAAHLADEIAVMDRGRIVESGGVDKVLRAPEHAVTRSLIAAASKFSAAAPQPMVTR